ncbi:hypothetical protein HK097_004326, partial [Rhizophlyctis rosea]
MDYGGYPQNQGQIQGSYSAADAAVRHAQESGHHVREDEQRVYGDVWNKMQNRQFEDDDDDDDVTDERFSNAHRQVYGGDGSNDPKTLGAAAAAQAYRDFEARGGTNAGLGVQDFIGMAMSEASKVSDRAGPAAGGQGAQRNIVMQAAQ